MEYRFIFNIFFNIILLLIASIFAVPFFNLESYLIFKIIFLLFIYGIFIYLIINNLNYFKIKVYSIESFSNDKLHIKYCFLSKNNKKELIIDMKKIFYTVSLNSDSAKEITIYNFDYLRLFRFRSNLEIDKILYAFQKMNCKNLEDYGENPSIFDKSIIKKKIYYYKKIIKRNYLSRELLRQLWYI